MCIRDRAKLLRVLQDQEFERVGGVHTLKVNVRLVAATNRDLAKMVKEGSFRTDLYYRLNVFPIRLPSLRERPSDIPLLVHHFLDKFARKMNKSIRDLSPNARERLLRYSWPGNIRELQNVIERATILARGSLLEIDNALELRLDDQDSTNAPQPLASLEAMERAYILQVLERTGWVIEGEPGAAAILDLNPSTPVAYTLRQVTAGEYAARQLRHERVTRELIGPLPVVADDHFTHQHRFRLPLDADSRDFGVAAFVQDQTDGQVWQALALNTCLE